MNFFQGLSTTKKLILALVIFAALLSAAYIPKINHVGFLQDDWNTLFVTENRGAGELVFHYSIDRPLRGYLSLLEYRLFGTNMPAYQVTALLWRLLDTIALYLILMLIWPGKWKTNVIICTLILIYPGFHEQPNVFEYQAHLVSRMCLLFSILFSILPFFLKQRKWISIFYLLVSVILAQISYGLMEYYFGIEVLRFMLFGILFFKQHKIQHWYRAASYILVFLVNAAGFMYWRLFIFESKRESVNAGNMLAGYDSLGAKLLENGRALAVNFFRLVISAYYKPLTVFGKYVDTGDLLVGILISLLAAIFIWMVLTKLLPENTMENSPYRTYYATEWILVGLVGSIGGLIPVIFGGREISYIITGDRFSYPGSISACLLVVGLIELLHPNWLRTIILSSLVFLAVLTQYTNDTVFAKNDAQTSATWWQMSWRAPQIQPQTLLSGRIYLGILDEDYTLWGPANLIYYPENRDVTITAEVLDEQTKAIFLAQGKALSERKGIAYEKDFANLLLISKTENACLHVIDGEHPEYSQLDDPLIRQVGSLSQLERIDPTSDYDPHPRTDLFGKEPDHNWCFYYQKAQLERQKRDWQAAAVYGDEALTAGFVPNDAMEWLVFLHAFAYTGDANYAAVLVAIKNDEYTTSQACQVFSSYNNEIAETDFSAEHLGLLNDICN